MNFFTARTMRTQMRARLLGHMNHDDYTLYRIAETEYHRQLSLIRRATAMVCVTGGAVLGVIALLSGTGTMIAAIALIVIGLTLAALTIVEDNRATSHAQNRLNETISDMLDNEHSRRGH